MSDTPKRYDIIALTAEVSDGFKDRVFKAFDSYWALSDLKWEQKEVCGKSMLVLTSATMANCDSAASSSINAMRDGLNWGYQEGLLAPRPKPPTKAQRAIKLYDEVHGRWPQYLKIAQEELKLTPEKAEYYYDKARAIRNPTRQA